jgi:HSP20 family protein
MEVIEMMRSPMFSDMVALRDAVDHLMNEPFRGGWGDAGRDGSVARAMPLDVYATDEQVVILAAIPGMRPEDMELTVHQNTVTLSGSVGDVAETEEAKSATWYVHELSNGTYRRSVTLPFPLDADKAEATCEHGILRVVLPKAETARPKKIAVGSRQREALSEGESNETSEKE